MIVTDMDGNPVLLTYVDISSGHTLEPGRDRDGYYTLIFNGQ